MPVQRLSKVLEIRKLTDDAFMLRPGRAGYCRYHRAPVNLSISNAAKISCCGAQLVSATPKTVQLPLFWKRAGREHAGLPDVSPVRRWMCCGPLGHGFDVSGSRLLLIGGGIGAPPLLYAARKAAGSVAAVLGFRTAGCVILQDEFKSTCDTVCLTTDDGTAGEHGFVTDVSKRLLEENRFDAVLACGPKPMLKAVAALTREYDVSCQVSLEERMGCGVGACLVCACKTVKDGSEHMSRVCRDGPVFNAREVVWE